MSDSHKQGMKVSTKKQRKKYKKDDRKRPNSWEESFSETHLVVFLMKWSAETMVFFVLLQAFSWLKDSREWRPRIPEEQEL
jgi:hypothetical protein